MVVLTPGRKSEAIQTLAPTIPHGKSVAFQMLTTTQWFTQGPYPRPLVPYGSPTTLVCPLARGRRGPSPPPGSLETLSFAQAHRFAAACFQSLRLYPSPSWSSSRMRIDQSRVFPTHGVLYDNTQTNTLSVLRVWPEGKSRPGTTERVDAEAELTSPVTTRLRVLCLHKVRIQKKRTPFPS